MYPTKQDETLPSETLLWSSVVEMIDTAERIVISTHENSDGDGLGSQVALIAILRNLGKQVTLINPTAVPKNYQFLPFMKEVWVFDEKNEQHIQRLQDADLFFLLDTNNIGRTRAIRSHVLEVKHAGKVKIICIDHHLEPQEFADVMLCRSSAAATGELMYELVREMERYYARPLLDKTVATGLYTAIMTDTASFKLPKTTARIHRITAELLDVGVSPMEIYDHVYNTLSLGTLQLIAQGIANLHTLEDGAIAYLFVTQAMLRETGVGLSDTERLLEYLLGLPTTKIAVMFIEMPDGTTKISFRSRGNLAVNKIAKSYGGGGHQNAAGCTAPFPLQQTISQVLPQCAQMLHTGDFTPTKT